MFKSRLAIRTVLSIARLVVFFSVHFFISLSLFLVFSALLFYSCPYLRVCDWIGVREYCPCILHFRLLSRHLSCTCMDGVRMCIECMYCVHMNPLMCACVQAWVNDAAGLSFYDGLNTTICILCRIQLYISYSCMCHTYSNGFPSSASFTVATTTAIKQKKHNEV